MTKCKELEKRNISEKDALIWNMLGSLVYALTSMLLGVAVTRIVGADAGGIFFFAFSTLGQQIYSIAYFGMRPVQITDVGHMASFGDYRYFRIWTACVAFVCASVYTLLFQRDAYVGLIWILLSIYRIIDGFADVYESELQRQGRLDITGKSTLFRTILSVAIFLFVLCITKNLLISILFFIPSLLLGVYMFARNSLIGLGEGVDYARHGGHIVQLFQKSKWLFLGTFLDLYIFAASKYAINTYMDEAYNSYFSIIFIPTSIINLMAGFVIRPLLVKLSLLYSRRDMQTFKIIIFRVTGAIFLTTLLAMLGAFFFAIPILYVLLGKEIGGILTGYKIEILFVLLGGGFYAILNLLYYCLVIFEKQNIIFILYAFGTGLAFLSSHILVYTYGMMGAALSYLFVMAVLTVVFTFVTIYLGRKKSIKSTDEKD